MLVCAGVLAAKKLAFVYAVSWVARDVHRTSDLLTSVLAALQGSSVQQLPLEDVKIGNYVYSEAERSKGIGANLSRLESLYRVRS
jgi:hypothetical protein